MRPKNWGELLQSSRRALTRTCPRSDLRQRNQQLSLLSPFPSLLAFGRSGLFGPPLCGGSAPATPPPTTCLADLVSILVTGAQSKVSSQTTSRQSPADSNPALSPRPRACPAFLQKPINDFSHRWHGFPARLFPPQNRDALGGKGPVDPAQMRTLPSERSRTDRAVSASTCLRFWLSDGNIHYDS